MKHIITGLIVLIVSIVFYFSQSTASSQTVLPERAENTYWFLLHRQTNLEFLFQGVPGDQSRSTLIKTFDVKTGQPGKRPTPLPQVLGRDYWVIVNKLETTGNPEIAPFFLTLDIPYSEEYPFGPIPYLECNGQCNWETPGSFGLHGINGDLSRLAPENPGSSGCIRHRDEDITYLYSLLNPKQDPIRYYVEDK